MKLTLSNPPFIHFHLDYFEIRFTQPLVAVIYTKNSGHKTKLNLTSGVANLADAAVVHQRDLNESRQSQNIYKKIVAFKFESVGC
jgi:hypothetical protein